MTRKIVSGLMLTLLLIGMLAFAFNVQSVKAEPRTIIVPYDYPTIQTAIDVANPRDTILVKDGEYTENVIVDKKVSLIGESRNTIIEDISAYAVILVQSDNVSVAGFTIRNVGTYGIFLQGVRNCNISTNYITTRKSGIYLAYASNNNIIGNNITSARWGAITLLGSSNNNIIGNNVTKSEWGLHLIAEDYHDYPMPPTTGNIITENNLVSNEYGLYFGGYPYEYNVFSNRFYHNNLMNNTQQMRMPPHSRVNTWDDGYPSGGNYWSDYTGVDADDDGIGETPYIIDANNQDNYPFMKPWSEESSPIDVLEGLIQTAQSWDLNAGIENSLTSKLRAAYRSLEKENQNAALGQLGAFVNHVEALRGNKLTDEQADYLLSEAQRIISLIEE